MKPTTDKALPLVLAYLDKEGNGAGGSLHIVLEDGNLESDHIEWCKNYAKEKGDIDGAELAELLLQMTMTQRKKIYKHL